MTQNVAFQLSNNFCPIKNDLAGNTVWPQASGFQKLAKMKLFGIYDEFGDFLKNWNMRSNSVTRRVNFIRTKIDEKWQNWKFEMRHFESFLNNVPLCETRL